MSATDDELTDFLRKHLGECFGWPPPKSNDLDLTDWFVITTEYLDDFEETTTTCRECHADISHTMTAEESAVSTANAKAMLKLRGWIDPKAH